MDESNPWELRRYVTLLLVLTLHVALFSLLLLWVPARAPSNSPAQSIELLFLNQAGSPKVVVENFRPQHLNSTVAVAKAPPMIDSLSWSASSSTSNGSKSESDGNGSGVDWTAEAHRAIQAFEIRSHQPKTNVALSSSPAEEQWWPWTRHRAGDKFKTANGDWIVWINSNCYQVASSGSRSGPAGETLPSTICLGDARLVKPN